MADDAETLKRALVRASNKLLHHRKGCDDALKEQDNVTNQLANNGLLETVTKSFSEDANKRTTITTQKVSLAQATSTLSLPTSVTAGHDERTGDLECTTQGSKHLGLADCLKAHSRTSSEPRRLTHPQVVIPKSRRDGHLPVRSKACPESISLLRSRAATESWDDGELEAQSINGTPTAEDTSADELACDTSRPAKSTTPAHMKKKTHVRRRPKLPKLARTPKSMRRVSKHARRPVVRIKPIEWVFWIQVSDEVGYWRSLSDFSSATRIQFQRKFDTDFLQTPRHIRLWRVMLSNRDKYLDRDMCVGNVTYWSRNEPSKWEKAQGDKEKTCDTCFNAGRLCAKMVKVGDVVKLAFFPALDAGNTEVDWRKIHHWDGERKWAKRKEAARRELSSIG